MDNFTLGGEPSTSHALRTPCSLMLLPGSWLGFGVERMVFLPAGPGQVLWLCLHQGLRPFLSCCGACGAAVLSSASLEVA